MPHAPPGSSTWRSSSRHLGRLRASLDGPEPRIGQEGFAAVVVLRDPAEADLVTIRRVPPDDRRL